MSHPLPSTDPQAAQQAFLTEKALAHREAVIRKLEHTVERLQHFEQVHIDNLDMYRTQITEKDAEIEHLKLEMDGVDNAKEEIGRLLGLTEEFRWKRISAAIHEQKRLIRELVSVLNRTHRHVAGRNPPLCDEMFAALQKARAIGIEP